ncbi:MAG TPA: N-acetylmuramoyl-L-alanine amidase [Chloroflexota bacterium]|nr:N-acetylmuramoyl-L-alanine amidase [Chloroflexota bacterium]
MTGRQARLGLIVLVTILVTGWALGPPEGVGERAVPGGGGARAAMPAAEEGTVREVVVPPGSSEIGGAAVTEPEPAVVPGAAGDGGPGALPAPTATPLRIPRPDAPAGPRRIGLQVGHWRTEEMPEELRRLENATGTRWGAVTEVQLNLEIANRVAAILRDYGYAVDVLPAALPPRYLAEAFVALHADGDTDGSGRGYKVAHGSRRGPYEAQLVRSLSEEYGRATGLTVDPRVTRNMLGYYAFSWSRYQSAVAPHTPAAILEMGFLTNGADRAVLLQRSDLVTAGIVNGLLRFMEEVPPGAPFAEDIVVPPPPSRTPRPQ